MQVQEYTFFHKLQQLPFIEAIWLYGSRARGDNTERSDIDLALLCPQVTDEEWHEVCDIIANADTLLHIDFLRFDTLKDEKLKNNILRFRKILYEKQSL